LGIDGKGAAAAALACGRSGLVLWIDGLGVPLLRACALTGSIGVGGSVTVGWALRGVWALTGSCRSWLSSSPGTPRAWVTLWLTAGSR